jgi:DNA-binding transcriptional ArsR family regulator
LGRHVLLAALLVATASLAVQASALEPVEAEAETGLVEGRANTSGLVGNASIEPHPENATNANDSARANLSSGEADVAAEADGGDGRVNASLSSTALRVHAGDGEVLEVTYRAPAAVDATERELQPSTLEPHRDDEAGEASQAAASPEDEEAGSQLGWTVAPLTGLAAAAAAGHALPVGRWARRVLGLTPTVPMFSRIARSEMLEHEAREAIYELLDEQAGLSLERICEELGLARSTARHHVRKLEQASMLEHTRLGRARVHHLVGERQRAIREHLLTNETRADVYEAVADEALTISEIAERLEANPGSVHFHLGKLADVGLVETVGEDGRRYRARDPEALEAHAETR